MWSCPATGRRPGKDLFVIDTTARTSPAGGDPIDWARDHWADRGLGSGADQFIATAGVLRYSRLMVQRAESELRGHGLNLTDYMLLMSLILSPEGARPVGSLARTLLLHTTTATTATDRLEIRGLLVRRPDATDRRTTLVSITEAGRELGREATATLCGVDFGLGSPGGAEQHELLTLLTALTPSP